MAEVAIICLERMNRSTDTFNYPDSYQQLRELVRPIYEEYMNLNSITPMF